MFEILKRTSMFKNIIQNKFISHQKIQKSMDTRIITPKFSLTYNQEEVIPSGKQSGRPLVVLMSWLRAKDKHLDLYNDFYTKRGFDVLTAKVTGYDMFYPDHTGKLCLNVLKNDLSRYDSILIHSFSFGIYVLGTMLLEMEKRKNKGINTYDVETDHILVNRIKGIVLDSVVTADLILGLPERTKDLPRSYRLYMKFHKLFLKVHRITTNYLLSANEVIYNNPLPAPALVMVSDKDPFGNAILSEKIVNIWRNKGIDVKYRRWKNGGHVQLMRFHQDEYGQLIDELIGKTQTKRTN